MEPDLLTTGEAAKLCGVTSDAVLKWIKKGRFPAIRTSGGHFRIARKTLQSLGYLDDLPTRDAPQQNVAPKHCWEYFCRNMNPPEACRECIVYRARIEKCYEVAELGEKIGHNRQFCQATCQNCSFFRSCKGLATTVLVVTSDESLISQLKSEANAGSIALRFAHCGYESSMLIDTFHPSIIVMDSSLPEVKDGRLIESMVRDERVLGVKVLIAQRDGNRVPVPTGVLAIEPPFGVERIEQVAQTLEPPCGARNAAS
jgi:excisionase family DNA binding protein